MIRPQQKRAKAHREYIGNLKMGDKIITAEGIHGHITALDDATVTLEIADHVRVKVARNTVSGSADTATPQPAMPAGGG